MPQPFLFAATRGLTDFLQPDIQGVGGLTACLKICHIAEAAGIPVLPHTGMNTPYGQHLSYATPNIPLGEYLDYTDPGVPLDEEVRLPGSAVPHEGHLVPSDAPGFGITVSLDWLEAAALR